MARYLSMVPVTPPHDFGVDDQGRAVVGFNLRTTKVDSATFLEEVVKVLTTAGVGTYGTNIHTTSFHAVPNGDGPFLAVRETGGIEGLKVHNQPAPAYPRPSAQIVVRAATYAAARTMAKAAYDALAAVVNQAVTP